MILLLLSSQSLTFHDSPTTFQPVSYLSWFSYYFPASHSPFMILLQPVSHLSWFSYCFPASLNFHDFHTTVLLASPLSWFSFWQSLTFHYFPSPFLTALHLSLFSFSFPVSLSPFMILLLFLVSFSPFIIFLLLSWQPLTFHYFPSPFLTASHFSWFSFSFPVSLSPSMFFLLFFFLPASHLSLFSFSFPASLSPFIILLLLSWQSLAFHDSHSAFLSLSHLSWFYPLFAPSPPPPTVPHFQSRRVIWRLRI